MRASQARGSELSISAGNSDAIDTAALHGYESVTVPDRTLAVAEPVMMRRRSMQPSRRAVLHVQTAGDSPVPPDLASWFSERAFHFYLAALRSPIRPARGPGRGRTQNRATLAHLDAACAHVRQADGMEHVIVTAQGQGAIAAARWSDLRRAPRQRCQDESGDQAGSQGSAGADALILYQPALPARPALHVNIGCPVLVLTDAGQAQDEPRRRALRMRNRDSAAPIAHLGDHVTWLRLPDAAAGPDASGCADRRAFFDELGRWLGAYMYGQLRDQLL